MDRGPAEYAQSDQNPSAAPYQPTPDVRPATFSSAGTPTSEYGLNPSSARSSTFPDYLARQPYPDAASRYHPPPNQTGAGPDPSTAATSPTYPPPTPYGPYPPPPPPDMSPAAAAAAGYPGQPGPANVYGRAEWGPYPSPHPHGLPPAYGAHPSPSTTVSSGSPAATAGPRPGQTPNLAQVYSFVPIPGAQQHKRPRRRYEEIERMYKCGWNGCEKAYGTLNHLNAHVTMQAHGAKRTPEEFKEIRKEWKARKKDEENQRKSEDRQRAGQGSQVESPNPADGGQGSPASSYPSGVRPQLPPIAYAPGQGGPVPGHYGTPANGIEQMQQYNSPIYSSYPPSPYGQGGQVYQQHPDVPANNYQS